MVAHVPPQVKLKPVAQQADAVDVEPQPDRFEIIVCRGCDAAALRWPEGIVHASQRCPGRRPDGAGLLERLVLAPIAVEPVT